MGMQQENKSVPVWKLAEHIGKSVDTFGKALKTNGITVKGKNALLSEVQAAIMCKYYRVSMELVPFATTQAFHGSLPVNGNGVLENSETVKNLESRIEKLSAANRVIENERNEYQNALTEKDFQLSALIEKMENEVSRNSEIRERSERLEFELSEARGKYENHISETAQQLAEAKTANANYNRVRAEHLQALATISNQEQEIEVLKANLTAARKGWSGFTEYDLINTVSMIVFMWAAFTVADFVGLGAAFLGALYMKRTIYNMKTSLSESARKFGFRVCAGIEIVAGVADYLGLYKSLKDLSWLPIQPNYVAIGGAAFVILISIGALFTTKKENEI